MRLFALIAVALANLSCVTTVYTTGPRCPEWSEDAVAELEWLISTSKLPALEEAIGRQELYCQAMEPADDDEACVGSALGCWWRSL